MMPVRRSMTTIAVVAAVLGGCRQQPSPTMPQPIDEVDARPFMHFTDVTSSSGIEMTWTSGATPASQIVEVKGGGVALIDYDNDGDHDLFVPNGATMDAPDTGPGCRLYENLGDLKFRDVTAKAELTFNRWGIGVAVGDYDADGHDDLYITCIGVNALLRNTGDGRFEETTITAGVGGTAWSAAAAFGDLDADGDLDLYVANYLDFDMAAPPPISSFKGAPVFLGPRGLPPQQDVLYENLGDGTFRDVTVDAGCKHPQPGFGLGVVILDFDGDGRQDIYVGNDSTPNFLYLNQGDLTFDEVGMRSGLALNIDGSDQSTMGIAIGDVSGTGTPDIFTTNFSNDSNTLHINKGGRFFDDETRRYGVGMQSFASVGWAAAFQDFDHDGDEDLVMFNGHVYPNATVLAMDSSYLQPPLLYRREARRFVQVVDDSTGPWLHEPHCDRGAAFGDLDADGDIDMVVVEINGPIRLLRNDTTASGWLVVRVTDDPLGVVVEAHTGEVVQRRWIYSGGSFASASSTDVHFGMPSDVRDVDLVIRWPDGHERRLDDVAFDQHVLVERSP